MGLPKEPRQKMINMMYLVLTALLALNVSTEVLEAFKTVDKSIKTSNDAIDSKNKVIYESFAEELKDGQTKAKAEVWAPKADQVRKLAADATAYLESMKKLLKEHSGLKISSDGKEDFKEDDLDAATKLFTEGEKGDDKGEQLYKKLADFRKQALAILNPDEFKDNPALMADVKKAKEQFEKNFPVNLAVEPGTGNTSTNDPIKDWENKNFHMSPTIAVITILSKYQNDVKNSEAQLVDYFHSQIGKVKVVFDQFQAIAQSNTSYAMPGDNVEITAGVGAFSAAAKPKIYISGQLQNLTPEGTAVFKTNASGAGEHTVDVKIEYIKPDGTVATVNKPVKYTVGVPSGASVFLEKMNVLYVGVENPLTISAGSSGKEKMNVSFTNGSISPAGGDRYVIKPTALGPAKINVTVNGKTTPFEMRCKRLPDPTPTVANSKGGRLQAAIFKAQGGVIAKLLDSEFDAQYQVLGYTVGANGGSFPVYRNAANEGARWTGNAAQIISQAGPGTSIFFDNIRVKGPDGVVRDLGTLAFQLQ